MRISDWSSDVCSSDLRIDLSPSLEAFTELTYTKRSVPAFQVPLSGEFGLYGYALSYVPATNPFNPFGVDVGVSYTFRNTGIFTNYSHDNYLDRKSTRLTSSPSCASRMPSSAITKHHT